VETPEILTECAVRFGSQCIVASIDAKRQGEAWLVYTRGGRTPTSLDAVTWARECVRRGAGELLITSIDRDGARTGYDLELTAAIADAVDVPVVASGGAGSASDVCDALVRGRADAALVAGILHDGVTTVQHIKREMGRHGIPVRAA
jgi:cyclase